MELGKRIAQHLEKAGVATARLVEPIPESEKARLIALVEAKSR